jgi:hypothetical protein
MVTARTTQEDPMRKLTVKLSAAVMIVAGTVAALQAGASAATLRPEPDAGAEGTTMNLGLAPGAAASRTDPVLSFTTKMISYVPVGFTSGPPAAGDGYVIASKVTRYGVPDGLATAHCTFTDTKGPVLRVCTVDYALDNGLIITDGYINGPGQDAPVTLVIAGGTGAYADARGYGTLQPTAAGSDVTLRLAG